jgi:hypothetical protein
VVIIEPSHGSDRGSSPRTGRFCLRRHFLQPSDFVDEGSFVSPPTSDGIKCTNFNNLQQNRLAVLLYLCVVGLVVAGLAERGKYSQDV